jgi:hypothetical protein
MSENKEFVGNLISDLGPYVYFGRFQDDKLISNSLLQLFGEKFAQQFMSQSTSWADSFIFAMAPLGVITAIIGK